MFILEFMKGLFRGNALDVLSGCLLVAVTVIIAWALISGMWYVIDSSFLPTFRQIGTVSKRERDDDYTTSLCMMWIGGLPMFIAWGVDEEYEVTFRIGSEESSASVTRKIYRKATRGKPFRLQVARGRMSGKLYIKDILE